jgi:hypothetical protein
MALGIGRFVAEEPSTARDAENAERGLLHGPQSLGAVLFNPQATLFHPDGEVITSESMWTWEEHQ